VTGTTYVSVSLWFRTATTSSSGPLFCEQNAALTATPSNATCSLYVGTDGKLHGQWYVGSGSQMVSTTTVNDTNWHHVVLSGANGTQQLAPEILASRPVAASDLPGSDAAEQSALPSFPLDAPTGEEAPEIVPDEEEALAGVAG